jgi:DNA-binding CsgD family transcriptional regulator
VHEPKPLLRAIELIHAAALAPSAWPCALDAVSDLLAADHAVLHAGESNGAGPPLFAYARLDPRDLAECNAADQALRSEFTTQFQLPLERTTTRAAVIPDRDYERSAYYNEVLRRIDGFHCVYFLQSSTEGLSNVAVCRGRRRDDFDAQAVATLEILRPHFRLAVEVAGRLQLAEARAASLAGAIDRISTGILLVDAQGQTLHLNAPAAAIAAEADGLVLAPSGLAATTPAATEALHRAMAALTASGNKGNCESLRVFLPRPSGRPPLQLTLVPLGRLDVPVPGAARTRVAIFIDAAEEEGAIDRGALAEAFRLTTRETDIALLLAQGADVAAIAQRLGIGPGTVRFHLKNAFAKTEARGQVALAALIRRFARH